MPATPAGDSRLAGDNNWRHAARNPQLWLVLLALAGTNGTFYAFAGLWGTRLPGQGFSLSDDTASWIITAFLVPYGLGSLWVGHCSDRLRTRRLFVRAAAATSALAGPGCW